MGFDGSAFLDGTAVARQIGPKAVLFQLGIMSAISLATLLAFEILRPTNKVRFYSPLIPRPLTRSFVLACISTQGAIYFPCQQSSLPTLNPSVKILCWKQTTAPNLSRAAHLALPPPPDERARIAGPSRARCRRFPSISPNASMALQRSRSLVLRNLNPD
jgi:hypothetical protein